MVCEIGDKDRYFFPIAKLFGLKNYDIGQKGAKTQNKGWTVHLFQILFVYSHVFLNYESD